MRLLIVICLAAVTGLPSFGQAVLFGPGSKPTTRPKILYSIFDGKLVDTVVEPLADALTEKGLNLHGISVDGNRVTIAGPLEPVRFSLSNALLVGERNGPPNVFVTMNDQSMVIIYTKDWGAADRLMRALFNAAYSAQYGTARPQKAQPYSVAAADPSVGQEFDDLDYPFSKEFSPKRAKRFTQIQEKIRACHDQLPCLKKLEGTIASALKDQNFDGGYTFLASWLSTCRAKLNEHPGAEEARQLHDVIERGYEISKDTKNTCLGRGAQYCWAEGQRAEAAYFAQQAPEYKFYAELATKNAKKEGPYKPGAFASLMNTVGQVAEACNATNCLGQIGGSPVPIGPGPSQQPSYSNGNPDGGSFCSSGSQIMQGGPYNFTAAVICGSRTVGTVRMSVINEQSISVVFSNLSSMGCIASAQFSVDTVYGFPVQNSYIQPRYAPPHSSFTKSESMQVQPSTARIAGFKATYYVSCGPPDQMFHVNQ